MIEQRKKGGGPLKVFYFIDSLHLGGSEKQLVQTALRLDAAKYEVTVGCLHAEGPLADPLRKARINVLEFDPKGGVGSPSSVREMLRLARFLRRERYDVIHTFDLYSNLMGIPAAWLARVPLRISSRRDLGSWWWYTPRNRKILRKVLGLSHVIVVNSQAVRNFMIDDDGYSTGKIQVVLNGIDVDQFSQIKAGRREVLPGLNPEHRVVTLVANMNVATKGHAELIEAARSVCSRVPQARFVLVGDGRERAGLELRVQKVGLAGKVMFLGRRTDVPEILKCSDLSVLPSWAEGLPNVVMESVAVGTPVVATRVGGTPEIIEDEVSGLLVPPRDPAALAAAIIRLLEDPELAARMASKAIETLRERFSFSRMIQELEALYCQSLAGEAGPRN
ncbi:MAG: glycosyltransferase [Terriglobia bacterium]